MSDLSNDCYLFSNDSDPDRDLLLHYIIKSIFKKNYQCPFESTTMKKCLDIGYSSGFWMMEMSTDFPDCQFYGIDIDSKAPDHVYPRNCSFQKGNFLERLPYSDNSFDLVHVRMILFMLEPEQILFLLGEISRVTKQGGFVEFLELDLSTNMSGGPLLKKFLRDIKGANENIAKVANSYCLSRMDQMLLERGFADTINNNISVPLGNWGGIPGECSLTILKLLIVHDIELDLHHEDEIKELLRSIDKECEQHKPYINVFSGFSRKL